jgi:hypothetical protein
MSVSSGFDASDLTDVMKLRLRRRLCVLVVLFVTACASSAPTPAISPTTSLTPPQGIAAPPAVGASASATASGDPVQAAGFADWVSRFRDTARAAGIDDVVTTRRVDAGRGKLLQLHDEAGAASAKYGVPPQVLIAIWGIESDFGNNFGDIPTRAEQQHNDPFERGHDSVAGRRAICDDRQCLRRPLLRSRKAAENRRWTTRKPQPSSPIFRRNPRLTPPRP